jgi:flagellar basal-body rod modification protein FlgD
MVDSVVNSSLINSLNQGASGANAAKKTKSNEIGQDQFLQLLITQLKNQDPLDPMKNDQFAVDMAQFSQVEQLIGINEKLNKSSSGDLGSLASYLGREVVTKSDSISVSGNDGGRLKINLAGDAASVNIDILNSDGSVKKTIEAGALKKGENSINLKDLQISDGDYKFKVTAKSTNGGEITNKAQVAGIVSGFIPGADPKLLIGSKQISPSEIVRVGVAA